VPAATCTATKNQSKGVHGLHDRWYGCLQRPGIVDEGVTSGERTHKARHTAGQRLLDATGNLKAAQKLLGHTSIQTTGDIYVDWDDETQPSLRELRVKDPLREPAKCAPRASLAPSGKWLDARARGAVCSVPCRRDFQTKRTLNATINPREPTRSTSAQGSSLSFQDVLERHLRGTIVMWIPS